jgi:acyl-CoA thioesterase-2
MVAALRLERDADGQFTATPREGRQRRVFGGQLMGQALAAAGATVPDQLAVHLMHVRFLAAGDPEVPVRYAVEPSADRGSFAHRRVLAIQGEAPVLELTASFHQRETGPGHQLPPHQPPGHRTVSPDELPTVGEIALTGADETTRAWWGRLQQWIPAEVRSPVVPGRWQPQPGEEFVPRQHLWLRTYDDMGEDAHAHACAAAYCSDLFLLTAAMVRHGLRHGDDGVFAVTLNHTMWFHAPFRADEWWRYEQEGSWSGAARVLSRGQMFDGFGHLVATTMQEGLLRVDERGIRTGEQRLAC